MVVADGAEDDEYHKVNVKDGVVVEEDSDGDKVDAPGGTLRQRLVGQKADGAVDDGVGGVGDADEVSQMQRKRLLLVIKLVVFLDFLGVAVLVPLLSSYFRDLKVSNEMFGLVSACYSAAQIMGGLVFGTLSDHTLSRRTVLLISFVGSAVSYALVGISTSLTMLLMGRVLVGLVKQTMTVTTAIISEHTKAGSSRSKELSHHTAAATISFILGPSLGSFLYQHSKMLPPLVSSAMFVLNSLLVLFFIPGGITHRKEDGSPVQSGKGVDQTPKTWTAPLKTVYNNLVFTCTRGSCFRIVVAKLLSALLLRALSPSMFVGYFEERYNVPSHVLGYVSSYRATLSLLVTIYIIPKVTTKMTETRLVGLALLGITIAYLTEAFSSMLPMYLAVVVPLSCVARSTLDVCLKSLFTQRTRQEEMGAALGTMNVLTAVVGVVAPLYGGELFGYLGASMRPLAAAAHYLLFLVLWVSWEMRGEARDGRVSSCGAVDEKKGVGVPASGDGSELSMQDSSSDKRKVE